MSGTSARLPTVAVLGTGIMGSAFCRNLIDSGVAVRIYNRTQSRTTALAALGACVGVTPAQAVQGCSVIVASLFDDAASQAVLAGPTGAVMGMSADSVLVETSTLSLRWVAKLRDLCAEAGAALLDSPVCGSRREAEDRKVTFLVSGDQRGFATAEPVLELLSHRVMFLGAEHGSAMRLKYVNNLLNTSQMASLAQGAVLAERLGLSLEIMAKLVNGGSPGSPLVVSKLSKLVVGDPSVESALATTVKDLAYIGEAVSETGLDTRLSDAVAALYRGAAILDDGTVDVCSAVFESLRAAKC